MHDYVALMLVNMAAGLVMAAWYFASGMNPPESRGWAAGFIAVGAVALATGLAMAITWPLPAPYSAAFGEPYVLFGAVYLAAGIALWGGGRMVAVGILALVAGASAIALGLRINMLGLTKTPLLTMVGFVLTGLSGVLALPIFVLKRNALTRALAVFTLLVAAGIWTLIGIGGQLMHLQTVK